MEVNLYSGSLHARHRSSHAAARRRPHHQYVDGKRAYSSPMLVDYNSAKAALLAYTKTMSFELAPDNILVNSVCPALVHSPLWERWADATVGMMGKTRDEVYQNLAGQALAPKRFGRPEEVSGIVVFLASERASFITGCRYDVDGGYAKSI